MSGQQVTGVDVLAVMSADAAHADAYRIAHGVMDSTPAAMAEESAKARTAVEHLFKGVWGALEILEHDGQVDSPLAGFLRASLARAGGAARRAGGRDAVAWSAPDAHDCPKAHASRQCGCGFCRALNCEAASRVGTMAASGLAEAECIAIYDAVTRSNLTRDVKTDERKVAVVRGAQ